MAAALGRASEKEWVRLAVAAGLANDESAAAARAGRQVELRARTETATETTPETTPETTERVVTPDTPTTVDESITPSLVERIRAVLAA
jgi:hypothetical protein